MFFRLFALANKTCFFGIARQTHAIHAPAGVLVLACKVGSRVPQTALCASIWCAGLALLRCAFFADPIGVLFPLCFGECIFTFHLPTLMTLPLIQVLLAQCIPVHRLLFPHIKQKLPSERQTCLKRCQRERTVDQDLLPCAAACHPNVRRYWVSTDHVNDHARLYCASLRTVERVSEVGRDGKLVPGDFQLWVGAARV